jgi:zeta-carotene desaturase
MGVPTVPLTDLYNKAGDYILARGGIIHFRHPIEGFAAESSRVQLQLRNQDDTQQNDAAGAPSKLCLDRDFDFLILALPFDALGKVLPQTTESAPLREQISHFESAPITGIHLWFDRRITDLDHAVLLDRTIQWMFHKSRLQPTRTDRARLEAAGVKNAGVESAGVKNAGAESAGIKSAGIESGRAALQGRVSVADTKGALAPEGSYIELVVSSSKTLIGKSRAEIVDLALNEVREFFPAARNANLVKSTVIKEVNATYSPRPGIDAHRPTAATPWPRVFLAGDWTATGWPATMESAVRSGYLAAEALSRAAGLKQHFLSPDLTATGFMRLFGAGK